MADLLSSLGLLLRAPDEIKVTLLTSLVPYPNSAASIDSSPTLDQDSRILAVISHRDELDRHEEGRLVALAYHPILCHYSAVQEGPSAQYGSNDHIHLDDRK